ncbi:ammonium transporter Rh type A isoform X2 [Homalodisca vitripennis]|uniref:ammonium transporter Rh type A isoform X2 n=1 Tax=Homalodisca vitripennis TaxID=197043 RepID=UPI001EEBDDB4|nr:ammonium transporter Rh type A isoform X2 [Homalodisca vitripennis]
MKGAGRRTVLALLGFQALLIVLSCVLVRYDRSAAADANPSNDDQAIENMKVYSMFQDVHVMIFIGFGFLMTFLRRYGFSSVGFNFLLSAVVIQWAIICNGVSELGNGQSTISVTLQSLMSADITAAACLISMGAVLGKTSPLQLLIMGIIETAVYAANEFVAHHKLQVTDAGDSIFVHVFGAYFGLAVSMVLGKPRHSDLEGSSYNSDLFAMIGSVFLWICWPSFNSGGLVGSAQQRGVINTYLSLAASCVTAFAISALSNPKRKFDMVHIQNATLAGGVAIGTAANLMVQPFGAMLVGSLAGILSVVGFQYIQPKLLAKINLHDTCGVHNLHGMPGVFAGIVGALMAFLANKDNYGYNLYVHFPARVPADGPEVADAQQADRDLQPNVGRSAVEQALFQLLALGITLVVAVVTGAVTGAILKTLATKTGKTGEEYFFDDSEHWEIEGDEDEEDSKHHEIHEQVVDDKC